MRLLCAVLRAAGVFSGLLLVAMTFASFFGLIPDSDNIPRSLTERLVSSLPPLFFGILLILPQTLFLRGKRYLFLMFGYVALVLVALALAILGVVDYYTGDKHWLIIPTSLALLAVPVSNAFVFWYLGRRSWTPLDKAMQLTANLLRGLSAAEFFARHASTVTLLRWLLLLPSAYVAWWVALFVGLVYVGFLDWLCPPELMVSGMCTASWHRPAYNAGVVAGAGLAAGLVMLTVIFVAPSHRRLLAVIAFGIGSAAALYMAYVSDSWAAGAAAMSVGLIALVASLRTLS